MHASFFNKKKSYNTDMTIKIENLKEYAKNGNTAAKVRLAELYYDGTGGVDKSDNMAFYWNKEAAKDGNPVAQQRLANMYNYGKGVEKDIWEGIKWYKILALEGDVEAQVHLGHFYKYGTYDDEIEYGYDLDESDKWYLMAAEQGHPEGIEETTDDDLSDEQIDEMYKNYYKNKKEGKS